MNIRWKENFVFVGSKKIDLGGIIADVLEVEDRVIIRFLADQYADTEPSDDWRNIIALDKNGNFLWRVESPLHKNDMRTEGYANVFFNVYVSEDGVLQASLWGGFQADIDLETGKLSNPKVVR